VLTNAWPSGRPLKAPLMRAGALLLLVIVAVYLGREVANGSRAELGIASAALLAVLGFYWVELLYAAILTTGVLAPTVLGASKWFASLLLLVGVAAAREIVGDRRLLIPAFFLVYGASFLFGAALVDPNRLTLEVLRFELIFPAIAIVTAWVARDANVRRRLITLILGVAVIETVVVVVQAVSGLRGVSASQRIDNQVDAVTGTLGASSSGRLSLALMLAATVFLAFAVERAWRPLLSGGLAAALAFAGVLASVRGIFVFVPAVLGAVLLTYGVSSRRSPGARRALAMLLPAVAFVPLFWLSMQAVYPGATARLQTPSEVRTYLLQPHPGGALPQRGLQVKLAIDHASAGGLGTALFGRGLGVTWPTYGGRLNTSSDPNVLAPFLTPEQQTGGVWVSRILTELGWVGVLMFLLLIGYLVLLARRTRSLVPDATVDRALIVALPGLAALTFAGAFYEQVLDEPAYATIFWPLVGICLAIAHTRRSAATDTRRRSTPAGRPPSWRASVASRPGDISARTRASHLP
jgi:hypothetical protein